MTKARITKKGAVHSMEHLPGRADEAPYTRCKPRRQAPSDDLNTTEEVTCKRCKALLAKQVRARVTRGLLAPDMEPREVPATQEEVEGREVNAANPPDFLQDYALHVRRIHALLGACLETNTSVRLGMGGVTAWVDVLDIVTHMSVPTDEELEAQVARVIEQDPTATVERLRVVWAANIVRNARLEGWVRDWRVTSRQYQKHPIRGKELVSFVLLKPTIKKRAGGYFSVAIGDIDVAVSRGEVGKSLGSFWRNERAVGRCPGIATMRRMARAAGRPRSGVR